MRDRSSSRIRRAARVACAVVGAIVGSVGSLHADPVERARGMQRSGIVAVAPDAGLAAPVIVFARPTGTETFRLLPYGPGFKGGIRVAVGDVNGDGTPDVVTGPGRGGPVVRVFDGTTGAPLSGAVGTFNAYDPGFTGGVYVAAGDVNGDGIADIVTGAGKGREGPHVKVFDGPTLEVVADFYAFDPKAKGGVHVAAGDLNGDGVAEVVTGPDRDGDPHVRAFTGSGIPFASFFAYDRAFRGGIRVAVGDVDGLDNGEIVTAPGKGRLGPIVRFFNAVKNGAPVGPQIIPFDPGFQGGVFVAAGN